VEIADAKGDGNPVILHTDLKGELTIRDKNGTVLNQAKPDSEFCTHFTLCHWPNNTSPLYVLCSSVEKLWIMDFYGKAVTTLSAPDCPGMGTALGVPCQLKAGEPGYFAAVIYLKGLMNGSVIYIFDPSGKVVYQETVSEPLESIAALPSANGGAETLLIGGENRIWKYSLQGP
jgi:hypothetical protein